MHIVNKNHREQVIVSIISKGHRYFLIVSFSNKKAAFSLSKALRPAQAQFQTVNEQGIGEMVNRS